MLRVNDISRVLKGVSLITDRIIAHSGPTVKTDVTRMSSHISDMISTLMTVAKDYNNSSNNSSNSNSNDVGSGSSNNSRNNTKPVVHDPLEFPSISPDIISDVEVKTTENVAKKRAMMKANRVPSTPTERVMGFGGLAIRMALGMAKENISKSVLGDGSVGRGLSDENASRLSEALCRMRGAALKLGQMLSMTDDQSLPPALTKALERVRQSADYMPRNQLDSQLEKELGPAWRDSFVEFDYVPIAAASIGQVHRGTVSKALDDSLYGSTGQRGHHININSSSSNDINNNNSSNSNNNNNSKNSNSDVGAVPVAIKIQYPGVSNSIESDLQNLRRLMEMTNLIPEGLFVDQIIKVAGSELKEECDYITEAQAQIRYKELVASDPVLRKHVYVPKVYSSISTKELLVSELVRGIPVDQAISFPQEVRNAIARTVLYLTIKELFTWKFVQSDPNFANFLFDIKTNTLNLIDFGAAREYPKSFVDGYMQLVWAASNNDRDTILRLSIELGFLTGEESPEMINAHIESGLVVGEPFRSNSAAYNFGTSKLTERISKHGDTFMKYRLTPPPSEAYSLHRKLAGAFLLCIRLKAVISCRDILEECYRNYDFGKK